MRPADIVVIATDEQTEEAFLERMQDVDRTFVSSVSGSGWSRGHLTGTREGKVYTLVVARAPQGIGAVTETMRETMATWSPRYLLVVGTALAVENESPLGAVGIVPLICDFSLDRFQEFRDIGNCYRSDGGLFASALAISDQWVSRAGGDPDRSKCAPARVKKLAALSGGDLELVPSYLKVANDISTATRRAVLIERKGLVAAKLVEDMRHLHRMPLGFLMLRGISEVRNPDGAIAGEGDAASMNREACAARDVADFAVEMIRETWPVEPRRRR